MDQQPHMTKTEAHPYHGGSSVPAFDANCQTCRAELGHFGELLKSVRSSFGMTQENLASLAGVSLNTIQRGDASSTCPWRGETALAVFRALQGRAKMARVDAVAYLAHCGLSLAMVDADASGRSIAGEAEREAAIGLDSLAISERTESSIHFGKMLGDATAGLILDVHAGRLLRAAAAADGIDGVTAVAATMGIGMLRAAELSQLAAMADREWSVPAGQPADGAMARREGCA